MLNEIIKAVVLDDKIICGKCGHKIANKKGAIKELGKGTLHLKCKHRNNGKNCNTINELKVN